MTIFLEPSFEALSKHFTFTFYQFLNISVYIYSLVTLIFLIIFVMNIFEMRLTIYSEDWWRIKKALIASIGDIIMLLVLVGIGIFFIR